jgi:hypothetical protein
VLTHTQDGVISESDNLQEGFTVILDLDFTLTFTKKENKWIYFLLIFFPGTSSVPVNSDTMSLSPIWQTKALLYPLILFTDLVPS